jgi:hypothetical protein
VPSPTIVCILLLLSVGVTAAPALAETRCPAAAGVGAGPAEIAGEVRLAWIDERLSRTARHARRWTWGWGIGIGAATVANLAPLPFVARGDRIDWYVGAGTTVIGIVPLLIAPLDVIEDSRALHASLGAPGAGGGSAPDGEVCARLADAETRLLRDAKNQADGRRWWLHVGNVALNTGVGLFLGLGYHHWGAGALNAVSGSVIGEAIILTQPTSTIDDLRRYQAGTLSDATTTSGAGTATATTAATSATWSIGYSARF